MMRKPLMALAMLLVCLAVALPCLAGEDLALPETLPAGQTTRETALAYFAALGVPAVCVSEQDGLCTLDLGDGRTATVFAYSSGEMRWLLQNPDDALLSRWLDICLRPLLAVQSDPAQTDWDKEAQVGNALLDLEYYGEQAVRVLFAQIRGDEAPALDDMRVRLCERILNVRQEVPGGYANAKEYAQRLVILAQDALPPVDEKLFADDPTTRLVLRAVMDYQAREKADWVNFDEKQRVLCAVEIVEARERGDALTVYAAVREGSFACYGGKSVQETSGSICPVRLTFARDAQGAWQLCEYLLPGDGTQYAPSIRAMCGGEEALSARMLNIRYDALNARLTQNLNVYLRENGLDAACQEE